MPPLHNLETASRSLSAKSDFLSIMSTDAGDVSVGWTADGEWLEYTVDVTPGIYDLFLKASSLDGGEVEVSLGGRHLGSFSVVDTGSRAIFREFTMRGVPVDESGRQVLRLTMRGTGGLFDLRTLAFRDAQGDPGQGPGTPTAAHIDWDSYQRAKAYRGDNWCMTYAADGNLYTMMDDGDGFYKQAREWNSQMIRIAGGPDFTAEDTQACPGWPFMPGITRFYGYGTYAVGQRIYTWLWMSENEGYNRPIANRLIYTDDFGDTFYRWDGTLVTQDNHGSSHPDSFFFYQEQGAPKAGKTAYAFNWLAFCQNGQANSHADAIGDPYVYMYSVEQVAITRMSMIRVNKEQITDKSAYEYLVAIDAKGDATWSSDPSQRGAAHVWPTTNYNGEEWIWASWHPSVVWNEGLQRYIMVAYGITDPRAKSYWTGWCRSNSENSATVIMLHAKNPWGPWTEFQREYEWKVPFPVPASYNFDADASRTYQFKLNPKWIEDNGRSMWLIWSDAGGDWVTGHGHDSYWYNWNQVKIELDVEPDVPDGSG